MMFTLIALFVALASILMVLGGLRMVAQDTFALLSRAVTHAQARGMLVPRLAFALLWIMIFVLSYH